MVVYPGGQCRGDTPPHEIKTSGAAGAPAQSEFRRYEESKGCPFQLDHDLPFPQRSQGLSLEVLQPHDAPKGKPLYEKDYMMSLITEDISGAQPMLGHPTCGNIPVVPWKLLDKPPLPEVPGSRSKVHYPPVHPSRPRDLSLKTSDIEGCLSAGTVGNCEGRLRVPPVDPLSPSYKMSSSTTDAFPSAKVSAKYSLDISDIEGASAAPMMPLRSQYGNPLKNEDEFKSRKHLAALADVTARALGLAAPAGEDAMSRRTAGTPRLEGPRRSNRQTDPLTPRYQVPLARDAPGTSLCCTWAEEKRHLGATAAFVRGEIGDVAGSRSNANHRDNGAPTFNLDTHDVAGAQPLRRIGAMPHSIYGPHGNRRDWNSSLDTRDVKGAQADTLARYPKVSSLNSARSPAEGEQVSVRGKVLRSCPDKL